MELPLTPLDFAHRARKLYGHREAVVDGDVRLSYEQFFQRCDRWALALQRLGVRKGDRVAIISPNTHAMLESFYAVPQIGAILVPLNYRVSVDDFVYMLQHSGARVVCVHPDYLDAIDSVRDRLIETAHFVAFDCARNGWIDYEAMLAEVNGIYDRPQISESDPLTINYTSGTTSRPKGVVVTHRNAWVNVMGTLAHVPMTQADSYLWTLPMFHANGWTFVWIVTAVGGKHVCLGKIDARAIYNLVNKEKISLLCAAPTVLICIANGPEEERSRVLRGVRVLTAGAAPAAATIERIEGELRWQVAQVYGLTEAGPFVTICEKRPQDDGLSLRERAIIKARQGVDFITAAEVRVVDESGNDVVKDGQTLGEIVARGNAIMQGYYKDPGATQEAFREGWFHSGDAAVMHPDGYIEIRDRYKDIIISGGENVSSVEVESVLLRHPAVLEAAVIGVPHERWGEAPEAFIVLRAGENRDPAELREFCRARMAHFKVPHRFEFVAELPKTATGKVQKFILRKGRSAVGLQ